MPAASPTALRKPPVFIVGAPRSGTTLLRNILTRHSNLAICGETRFYIDIYRRRWIFGDLANPRNRRRLVEQYLAIRRIQQFTADLDVLKDKLLRDAVSYRDMLQAILDHHAVSQGKGRAGEKTPHHALCTEMFAEWFPDAAIIHLVRDPRDVVASLEDMPWAPRSVVSNALLWRLFNRAAGRSFHRPGYLLVHYEALASDPESELQRICRHLGEEYEPSMLAQTEPTGDSYSWPKSAHGPVTGSRQNRWRTQLSEADVALIESITRAGMALYGYQPAAGAPSAATVSMGLARAGTGTIRQAIGRLPYHWYRLFQPRQLTKQEYWKYRRSWAKTATFFRLRSWKD
ncbi:MAG TPA: sulfotransferase [Bryobacteraceae bacterium]|nr:sulfotransferase [Bryobacteraceae bacterium]